MDFRSNRIRRVFLMGALALLLILGLVIIWAIPHFTQGVTGFLGNGQSDSGEESSYSEIYYVAVGDSLTVGVGAEGVGGFVPELEAALREDTESEGSVTMSNYGRPGLTIDALTRQIENEVDLRQDLGRADLVTVTIGGNDLLVLAAEVLGRGAECREDLLECLSDDLADLEQRWVGMTSALRREMSEDGHLLVSTVYLPSLGLASDNSMISVLEEEAVEVVDEFNAMINRQAEGRYTVVDVRQRFSEAQADEPLVRLFSEDNIHPNRSGYEVMSEAFMERVRELMGDSSN